MSNQSADSSSKLAVNSSSRNPADSSTTRRDFLLLAGMTGVGASLIRPLNLFADAPASGPKSILVPANGHAAIHSAAKILAKKLKLDESTIQTYDGAPKPTAGAIVLALAKDGKLPTTEAPEAGRATP